MSRSWGRPGTSVLLAVLLAGCATVTPSPSPIPTASPLPTPLPTPTPTATPLPTPTPILIDQQMLSRRFTVLIAGEDTSRSRRAAGVNHWRTDALMLISISPDKSRIDMISVPRDTVDIPMADGTTYHGKINAISEAFGIEALRGAISTLLGVPIDRYVRVDMDDFAWMVDVVGGIDLEVKTRIVDPKVHVDIKPGPAHMNGAQALAFSRTRADSDYGRAARQQQVILALVRKWLDPGVAGFVGTVRLLASLETDIGLTEIPTLLEIGRRSATAKVTAIVLAPPHYSLFAGIEKNTDRGWVMIPDIPAMRRYARAALAE